MYDEASYLGLLSVFFYHAPGNGWIGGVSLKDHQLIMLEYFSCTMDKIYRNGGNKTQTL